MLKTKPEYATPRGVKIQWMNFLEGDDVRDGTAFNMTMQSNNINDRTFKVSVSLYFISITFSPLTLALI